MITPLALQLVLTMSLGVTPDADLIALGGSDARGRLVNLSAGARPSDPLDTDEPTFVITHGFNPLPGLVHFTFPETYARLLRCRNGATVNVLVWDWNADTMVSLCPRVNAEHAAEVGQCLARALARRGCRPECTQLIGHSVGCIVMTSAARSLALETGQAVRCLTLLDPLRAHHELIFERLNAVAFSSRVENIWAPGLSGYGAEAISPEVVNICVPGATPIRGVINPVRSNHLHVVRWHLDWLGWGR